MPRVAIASTSQLAADAGAQIADAGGSAVDAAVASALVSMLTEPGVCAPGGGGYVTIASPTVEPITIDGNVEMPGRGADPDRFRVADRRVTMAYGGGVETTVGYASVATPGAFAALGLAVRRWGSLPWAEVLEPAVEVARNGFPLGAASRFYLEYVHDSIFGWHPDSAAAIHDGQGDLLSAGDTVVVPGLAESMAHVAEAGPETLYVGDLAEAIAADFDAHGGLLTRADLAAYRPIVRPSAAMALGDWTVTSNPPPAIGGVSLLAMLDGIVAEAAVSARLIAERQAWLRRFRRDVFDTSDVPGQVTDDLLHQLRSAAAGGEMAPSTVHTSAVDGDGLACAITMSSGYGSGLIPAGTGMWMNNALGEDELNPAGFHALRPGTRLNSNMAPTIATKPDGGLLVVGSPGADRITSAIQQTLIGFVLEGRGLQESIDQPRLHVELTTEDEPVVAHEPGLDLDDIDWPLRPFDGLDMFFGGVTAADWIPGHEPEAAADPRRTGGVALGGRA